MANNLIHKRPNNIAIIIPAYNEAQGIASVISNIRKLTAADIIVVSDGSTDKTAEEARRAGAKVVELPINLGYGAALQTGYKYALERDYKYAVQMDADGQHDPSSIQTLIRPVMEDEVDVVIGSRFLGAGDYKTSLIRRLGIFFFSAIASIITRRKITDVTSGFQALNRKAMEFYASEAFPADYPDADVIIMLYKKRFRFKEMPVIMHRSSTNKSMHGGLRPFYYVFKMLLSIFVTLLRREEK